MDIRAPADGEQRDEPEFVVEGVRIRCGCGTVMDWPDPGETDIATCPACARTYRLIISLAELV